MRILIVGAGVVGYNLARQLSEEHHDIAVIDADERRLEELSESVDCLTVAGDGATPSVLERAGIAHCDLIIAVTDSDSVNLVTCMLADRFGAKRKVARVRNPEYSRTPIRGRSGKASATSMLGRLQVDYIINPDVVIGDSIRAFVKLPGALEAADFADGQIQLRTFPVPEGAPLANRTLASLREFTEQEPFLVLAIRRDETTIIPRGDDTILAGDRVVFIMPDGVQPFVLGLVGVAVEEPEKIVFAHATPAVLELARHLEAHVPQVLIIEPDAARADAVAADLKKTQVFRGSPTDANLLKDIVGIGNADFFFALGENDGHNLLAALLAKRAGCKRTGILIQESDYQHAIEMVGVDIPINARLLTMAQIIRYVRRGNILAVANLAQEDAEAIEFYVDETTKSVGLGKPLAKLGIPKGAIVAAVEREDTFFIPRGDTTIEAGDKVVVFALKEAIPKVEKLFARRGAGQGPMPATD